MKAGPLRVVGDGRVRVVDRRFCIAGRELDLDEVGEDQCVTRVETVAAQAPGCSNTSWYRNRARLQR